LDEVGLSVAEPAPFGVVWAATSEDKLPIGSKLAAKLQFTRAAGVAGNIRRVPDAARVDDVVARAQRGMARLDDLAHGGALERAPEREALHIGVLPAHPPAHVGIDGHPEILDEHIAVRGRRQLHGRHLEVRVRGHPGGIALEADLAAGRGTHRAPLGTAVKEVSSRAARGTQ
jgi:hypothetical protein